MEFKELGLFAEYIEAYGTWDLITYTYLYCWNSNLNLLKSCYLDLLKGNS